MSKVEKPRSEPEIIPPNDAGHGRDQRRAFSGRGTERVYVANIGPLGVFLAMLIAGIVFVLFVTLLLGAFLIWLPLLIAFVVGAAIAGFLRAYFRRVP